MEFLKTLEGLFNGSRFRTAMWSGLTGIILIYLGALFLSAGEDTGNIAFETGRALYAVGWAFMLAFCVRVVNFWSVIPVVDKYFAKLIEEVNSNTTLDTLSKERMIIGIKTKRAISYNRTSILLNSARWIALAIVISTTWGNP